MFGLLTHWLLLSLSILAIPYLIPGVYVDGFAVALAGSAVLAMLNLIVRPVLFFLTLPFTLITLGLFSFALNALMVYWAALLVDGFRVESFWSALGASLIISLVNAITTKRKVAMRVQTYGQPRSRPTRDVTP